MVWLGKKIGIKWVKNGAFGDFTQKCKCSGKAAFLESVSFHSQMLGVTNFGLVLGDCIVIAMNFIKNTL